MKTLSIDIEEIHDLSKRDITYWGSPEEFQPYIEFLPQLEAFDEVIEKRAGHDINRTVLVDSLSNQYKAYSSDQKTIDNIQDLLKENCYTLTTAHQPSLLTGPLYYILKILSVINLSSTLNERYPDKTIVPVFVLGSEDHDFEEIRSFNVYGKTISWDREAKGSVGDLDCEGLKQVIEETKGILGSSSQALELLDKIESEIENFRNYAEFAFRLTHLLFDKFGLVILRMDDPLLKSEIKDIILDDIFSNSSEELVSSTQQKIKNKLGFNAQAYVRPINFYYKTKGTRNRIEETNGIYSVLGSDLTFTEEELKAEVKNHPERFSPNVIARPLYQSKVLPDLAYIGGGGEIAYWTERMDQFKHYNLHFPMLIRRTSALISSEKQLSKYEAAGMSHADLFLSEDKLVKNYINLNSDKLNDLSEYKEELEKIYSQISKRIEQVDKTLVNTAGAEMSKAIKSIEYLENKVSKALKQKEEVNLNRIKKLKAQLFPSGLQERKVNVLQFLSSEGIGIIEEMLEHCNPLERKFKLFITQQS